MNSVASEATISRRLGTLAARVVRTVVFLVLMVHLVLSYSPWQFTYPGPGLESSWQQVVTFAAASGWQWGTDIAWTYGPLGFAWTPVYFEPLFAPVLVVRTLFMAALAWGILGILGRTPTFWAVALYVLIVFAGSMLGPGLYSIIPLLAALNYFRDPGQARLHWVVPLVVASGVLALTYGSSGVLSFALFVLMDLSRLARRRVPIFVLLMAGAALAGFFLAGQSFSSLAGYLRSLFELIAGYADAMSAKGHVWELRVFLALGLVSAVLVALCELPSLTDTRRRVDSALLLACMFVYWFIMFKAGFVRHDLHSLWAWGGLAIGLSAYVAIRPDAWSGWIVPMPVFMAIAAVACVAGVMLFYHGDRVSFVVTHARSAFVETPVASLTDGRELLRNTAAWRKAMQQRREAARAAVAPEYAELRMPGTVDMIGTAQGALLLQDVDFRTRPVFQDFAAYTPWLIERNRTHLRGGRAAETILLSTDTIDDRYPMMDRGMAVVELLTHYRPERIAAGYLVLRRRETPSGVTLTADGERNVELGQWIDVPASDAPVVLNADIRPNALGLLAKVLFRSPRVEITVKLADGTEHPHRIVPAYGRDGMLLSPYVDGIVSYAAMAIGGSDVASVNRVVAFKVDTAGEHGRAFFSDDMHIRLSSLRVSGAEERLVGTELRRLLDRRLAAYRMANAAMPRNPLLSARETVLLAHPPVTARLPVASARQLQITYGIADGAWKDGGATDGVCFRIFAAGADGARAMVHERCLRPVERTADRGEQRISLPLSLAGPGALVFETDCGGNCSWDWAFWKDIDVAP